MLPVLASFFDGHTIAIFHNHIAIDNSSISMQDIASTSYLKLFGFEYLIIKTKWESHLKFCIDDAKRAAKVLSMLLKYKDDQSVIPMFGYLGRIYIYRNRIEACTDTLLYHMLGGRIPIKSISFVSLQDHDPENARAIQEGDFLARPRLHLHFANGAEHTLDVGVYTDEVYQLLRILVQHQ